MRIRIALACVLMSLVLATAQAFQVTPVRVADAQCEKCHKQIFQKYLATPMAHASGTAAENLIPGKFLHAPSGADYSISDVHGEPHLFFRSNRNPDISGEYPLNYFLGS